MEVTFKESQIQEVARQLIAHTKSKVLCFYGDMGAGKTTLIKGLVKQLGGEDNANSPTFGIVNEYQSEAGALLAYHFDFYRLNDETEALDLGLEDYLNQNVWVFIEWPEKIKSFLPEDATNIFLGVLDPETRNLKVFD